MTALNQALLKDIANSSSTATSTMLFLGMRKRYRSSTTLSRVKRQLVHLGEKVVDKDYKSFWKQLEDAGAGHLVVGRKGHSTRFEWHYSLRQVAKSAIEGRATVLRPLNVKRSQEPVVETAIKQTTLLSIAVRPNLTLQVRLIGTANEKEVALFKNSVTLGK